MSAKEILCPVCGRVCNPRHAWSPEPWAYTCVACCPAGYVRIWPDYLFPVVPALDDDLIAVLGEPIPIATLPDISWFAQEGAA